MADELAKQKGADFGPLQEAAFPAEQAPGISELAFHGLRESEGLWPQQPSPALPARAVGNTTRHSLPVPMR